MLRQWKQRGFLAPDFEYEELTSHYMEQLNKAAKNLAGSIYEEHHKGEKVRIYRETTVMTNEEQSMTSKCLLLQSGQNQYSEEARQHLLQKYSSETVMATSKVNSLSSFQSVLFCLDNVPETYGKEQLKDAIVELLVTKPSKCVECYDMGQNDTIGKIELKPSIVLSSDNTNCKNDIQLFHQLFDELSVYRDYY